MLFNFIEKLTIVSLELLIKKLETFCNPSLTEVGENLNVCE